MDNFFLMGARPLVSESPSMKLHQLLDWGAIAGQLKGLCQREATGAGGPEPYSPLGMFKPMLLGQWHGLSDAQLEQALRVRLDLMVFTGFESSSGALPDASTICRFRNRLVLARLDQKLLSLINGQLEQGGLKVQGAQAAPGGRKQACKQCQTASEKRIAQASDKPALGIRLRRLGE